MQHDDPKLGRKFDSGKPRMGLLPPYALEAIAKVLTIGAVKYAPDNWKYVEGRDWRYLDAMLRHINSHKKGEMNDPETGLPHLAHAGCCLMFLLDELVSSAEKDVGGAGTNNIPVGNIVSDANTTGPTNHYTIATGADGTTWRLVNPGPMTSIMGFTGELKGATIGTDIATKPIYGRGCGISIASGT